jgi:hypothetical protein
MRLLNIRKNYFWAGVDCDYDTVYDCYSHNCGSICRCGVIMNARVTSVDTWSMAEDLVGSDDKTLLYCVDRLLVAGRIYEDCSWDVETCNSYYGEEIDGIFPESVGEINKRLNHLYYLSSDSERIKYVLIEEYGYLLDTIKDLEFSIENMRRDDVKIPNTSYHDKIESKDLGIYLDESWVYPQKKGKKKGKAQRVNLFNYLGPVCVVREDKEGNKILIDGYHRYSASANRQRNNPIKVVVGRLISDPEKK